MNDFRQCKIGDAIVEVECKITGGSNGSWDEPPEGPEVDIHKVYYKDRDITDKLREYIFIELCTQIGENYDPYDDYLD